MARLDAPLVFVEWHDAHAGGSNWMSIEEIEPGHVAIAQSLADSGDFDSPLYIPADMVIRTVVIGNPPPRDT
jgi:hypothetical protein